MRAKCWGYTMAAHERKCPHPNPPLEGERTIIRPRGYLEGPSYLYQLDPSSPRRRESKVPYCLECGCAQAALIPSFSREGRCMNSICRGLIQIRLPWLAQPASGPGVPARAEPGAARVTRRAAQPSEGDEGSQGSAPSLRNTVASSSTPSLISLSEGRAKQSRM